MWPLGPAPPNRCRPVAFGHPLLAIAVLALFAGPLLYHWMRRGGLIARTLEQALVAVLVLVVGLLLVPETLEGLGPSALALIAAGYLAPGLLEAAVRRAARAFHMVSLSLALAGLVLHAMLDGAGLASGDLQASMTLSLAIVLHRFSMGLVLWLIVQPAFGRRVAWSVLAGMAAATVLGYFSSESLLELEGGEAMYIIQALIIGTIIHSLVHRGHAGRAHEPETGASR